MTERTIDLPAPLLSGNVSSRCVEDIMRERPVRDEAMFKPGQEQLGYFYLPPFQRPPSWTATQSARLVESLHLGITIGSIVVTDMGEPRRIRIGDETVERFPDDADWLIDGQQRLRGLRAYLNDELTVFAGTPGEHRFGELSVRQQRRFLNYNVGFVKLDRMPVEELARIYDLLNFGGTPHTEDQRASGQATS